MPTMHRTTVVLLLALTWLPAHAQPRSVTIRNGSGLEVSVSMAPPSAAHQVQEVTEAGPIPPGGERTATLQGEGCRRDFTFVYHDAAMTTRLRNDVDLCVDAVLTIAPPAGETLPPEEANAIVLELANEADLVVENAFAREPGQPGWGRGLLPSALPRGETVPVRIARETACIFEFRAVLGGFAELILPPRDVCREPRVVVRR